MSTSIDTNFQQAGHPQAEHRILMHNISWETYEKLLADLNDQSSPRLAFNEGVLEIMAPQPAHERLTFIIEMMVTFLAAQSKINVYCLRSTTFKRSDLARGFEADTSFYVRNEAKVRGKDTIDLMVDPPPDLVVEVDITSGSMDKLPICASIRVPEIWRHDGSRLIIYRLTEKGYVESEESQSFPNVSNSEASEFIRKSKALTSTEFLQSLQEWVTKVCK